MKFEDVEIGDTIAHCAGIEYKVIDKGEKVWVYSPRANEYYHLGQRELDYYSKKVEFFKPHCTYRDMVSDNECYIFEVYQLGSPTHESNRLTAVARVTGRGGKQYITTLRSVDFPYFEEIDG